jgi:hypothetical protein
MTTFIIYRLALITHLAGLVMVAGTTLLDFIVTRQFWKQFSTNRSGGAAVLRSSSAFPVVFGIGFLFLIISGVYMMYITKGAYGEQVWFRVKFGLILLIILNGLAFGRRQGLKLRKILGSETPEGGIEPTLSKIKGNLNWFHFSQLVFFLGILTLSVFKFN